MLGSIGVPVAVIGQTDVVPGQGVPQHVHSIQAEVDASDDQLCQRGQPPGGQQVLDHPGGSLQDLGDVAAQSGDVVGHPLPEGLAGADQGIEALSDPVAQPLNSLPEDRKSTRLNSNHVASSYAGFCLKKTTLD